jgi:hypothetical protein
MTLSPRLTPGVPLALALVFVVGAVLTPRAASAQEAQHSYEGT